MSDVATLAQFIFNVACARGLPIHEDEARILAEALAARDGRIPAAPTEKDTRHE